MDVMIHEFGNRIINYEGIVKIEDKGALIKFTDRWNCVMTELKSDMRSFEVHMPRKEKWYASR